uniref:Uncharacterized protein n=1 Tax=Arundo donax TaxID=35708 RepID=A0A0A9BWY8_ARUDO
MVGGRLGF